MKVSHLFVNTRKNQGETTNGFYAGKLLAERGCGVDRASYFRQRRLTEAIDINGSDVLVLKLEVLQDVLSPLFLTMTIWFMIYISEGRKS
jgi:hypothetical protein